VPLSCFVGSFAKATGGAPVSQVITGVGFQPKVILFWTEGRTSAGSWSENIMAAIGFTTGLSASKSMSYASGDALAVSDTNRRSANKALTIINYLSTTVAECDLTSFDANGFTLNWTTNDTNAYLIRYMALGGSDLINANVQSWQTGTSTGNVAVTGVGFQGNFAMHVGLGALITSNPVTTGNIRQFLGAMTASAQWAIHMLDQDNQSNTNTRRAQHTDCCILDRSTAGSLIAKAAFVSFDSDGFTVNFSSAPTTNNWVHTLVLNVTKVYLGTISTATGGAPVSQSVTGLGYQPSALALFGFQNIANTGSVTNCRQGWGGGDGANECSGAFQSTTSLADSSCDSFSSTTKAFVKCDNNTPVTDAECDHALDNGGFTLTWTTNDAVADQIGYIAFGPAAILKWPNLAQVSGLPAQDWRGVRS
jgi:hypothetical protein